jgi:hypothetical protein
MSILRGLCARLHLPELRESRHEGGVKYEFKSGILDPAVDIGLWRLQVSEEEEA